MIYSAIRDDCHTVVKECLFRRDPDRLLAMRVIHYIYIFLHMSISYLVRQLAVSLSSSVGHIE